MLRLLILIALAYLVYRGISSLVGELRGTTPSRLTATVHREGTEELVSCARCGVRVPRSRVVAGDVCASCSGEQRT